MDTAAQATDFFDISGYATLLQAGRILVTSEVDLTPTQAATIAVRFAPRMSAEDVAAVLVAVNARADMLDQPVAGEFPPLSVSEIAEELERRAAEGDDKWMNGVATTYRWVARMLRAALAAYPGEAHGPVPPAVTADVGGEQVWPPQGAAAGVA